MCEIHLPGQDCLDQLAHQVEGRYSMKLREIRIINKYNYLLLTREGSYLLRKVNDKESGIIYVTGLYEYMRSRDFKNVLRIHRAGPGKYYIHMPDGLYMVTDYVDSRKYGMAFGKNANDTMKFLADFHRASEGYIPPPGGKSKSGWGGWIEKYSKEYKDLKKYRESVSEKTERTPFEEMFLNSCDMYMGRMKKSVKMLKEKGYLDIVEESMKKRQICLDYFNRSNFYRKKPEIYVRHLDKCRYDMVERDIADLLRKIVGHCPDRPMDELAGLISIYDSRNSLSQGSLEIIKAFILFPREYKKVCSKHCRSRDRWTEEGYVNKLGSAVFLEDRMIELVEALDHIKL